jgi:hypothetical protein
MKRTRITGVLPTHINFCASAGIGIVLFMKPAMANIPASRICASHKLT